MSSGAITAMSAAGAAMARDFSAAGIKLALTLLTETDLGLSGSGAPATPRPPAYPVVPLEPGLDFPALIAARLALAPRPMRSQSSNPDQRPRKRG
jgi:hypothetical protein